MRDLDLLLLAKDRLLEIDREVVAEVITLLRPTSPRTSTRGATWTTKSLEERFEEIGKSPHIAHVRCPGSSSETGFSKLVVPRARLRITENLIGTTNLFEPVLSTGFLIDIGVVLTR